MKYDCVNLKMQSCLGWSERTLQAETQFLARQASEQNGRIGEFFWVFPPPDEY
ncbi:MAG: hypothetical protein R3C28_17430 [Pirellulaceae bacterium]